MKITVYTITDCQFSKQEKEYLTAQKLQFEEKNLETNKEFLTEMLAVSNNFAGTPVTKIEKDDGQIVVLKGFTKDEFDKALGLAPAGEPPKEEGGAKKAEPAKPPVEPEEPKVEVQKPVEEKTVPPPPPVEPVTKPTDTQPTASKQPPPANDPLNSILNDLQAKSAASNAPADTSKSADANASTPAIPDFPSKT